jgi:hypothetical protein
MPIPAEMLTRFLAKLDAAGPTLGPDWQELRAEIVALGDAAFAAAGEPGSLTSLLYVESGAYDSARRVPTEADIYRNWAQTRRVIAERAAHAKLLAETYEVRDFDRNGKLGKPKRIPRGEASTPWRASCMIVTEGARVAGSNFDNDFGPSFAVKSTPIGSERAEGTIVAKRLIEQPDTDGKLSKHVQYLIKPRSAKAERVYTAKQRLIEITAELADVDYLTPARITVLHAERVGLQMRIAGLEK